MERQKPNKRISFAALRAFMRDPTITPLEKCVLINLLLYGGVTGNPFPSEETLGRDLAVSARHIRKQLGSLYEKGWIRSWKRRGFSLSNKYVLNEELYFPNDDTYRNSNSSQLGNAVPVQSGTTVPPNISQENNHLKNSHVLKGGKALIRSCNQNGCENGYIFHADRQTYSICECKER